MLWFCCPGLMSLTLRPSVCVPWCCGLVCASFCFRTTACVLRLLHASQWNQSGCVWLQLDHMCKCVCRHNMREFSGFLLLSFLINMNKLIYGKSIYAVNTVRPTVIMGSGGLRVFCSAWRPQATALCSGWLGKLGCNQHTLCCLTHTHTLWQCQSLRTVLPDSIGWFIRASSWH